MHRRLGTHSNLIKSLMFHSKLIWKLAGPEVKVPQGVKCILCNEHWLEYHKVFFSGEVSVVPKAQQTTALTIISS